MSLPSPSGYYDSHSRFVGMLRFALAGLGILLLALIVIWPSLQSEQTSLAPSSMATNEQRALEKEGLDNPVFQTLDEENRPVFIEAEHALSDALLTSEVNLLAPSARLNSGLEGEILLQSDHGLFQPGEELLNLEGGVSVQNGEGFELITEGVQVNLEDSSAVSDQKVTGQGPSGRVRAEGMEIRNKGRVIFLKGRSTIVMSPDDAQADQ